jgi:glycosyltransferase involved in cell wall biosynthesis
MNEPTPIPLTCYIRTLNEAKNIGPVVEKVKAIGAEVIVIDSFSTDGTQEIARAAGARVIENKWEGNGFQKRVGEDAAVNDWLLDMDADEILSPELQQELRAMFSHGVPEPGIYSIELVTVPPVPRGDVWYSSGLKRFDKLYHKSVVRIPAHAAWDHFEIPGHIKPGKLKHVIYHHSFRDIEQMLNKMNKVSSVRARDTKLKPKWVLAVRILLAFPIYFSKKYFKQKMYRTGIYGFSCAVVLAANRWLKDVKMYELHLASNGRNFVGMDLPPKRKAARQRNPSSGSA